MNLGKVQFLKCSFQRIKNLPMNPNPIENLDQFCFIYEAFLFNTEGRFKRTEKLIKLCSELEIHDPYTIGHKAFQEFKKIDSSTPASKSLNYFATKVNSLAELTTKLRVENELKLTSNEPAIFQWFEAVQPVFKLNDQIQKFMNAEAPKPKQISHNLNDLIEWAEKEELIEKKNGIEAKARYNLYEYEFNIWLKKYKEWDGEEKSYRSFFSKSNFISFLKYKKKPILHLIDGKEVLTLLQFKETQAEKEYYLKAKINLMGIDKGIEYYSNPQNNDQPIPLIWIGIISALHGGGNVFKAGTPEHEGVLLYHDHCKMVQALKDIQNSTGNNTPDYFKKQDDLKRTNDKTERIIIDYIDTLDSNSGWEFCFKNQNDLTLFVNLLAEYFQHKNPSIPLKKIAINRGSKTRLCNRLKTIHSELGEHSLRSDEGFYKVIKVIKDINQMTNDQIYKLMTK
jgi:hypothetical protein